MRATNKWSVVLCMVAVGCSDPTQPPPTARRPASPQSSVTAPPAGAVDAESIRLLNRAVGEMGQFEFERAERTFDELLARRPGDFDVRLNRAIATLNQSADGAQERALESLGRLVEERPDHSNTRYVAGLALLFLGRHDEALPHFLAAAEGDPDDAFAAYYVGLCLEYAGRREESLARYRRASELDPYLRSPLLRLQQVLDRLGRPDEAARALEAFVALDGNPRARLAEFKYTRMGPRSEVVVPDWASPTPGPAPAPPYFEERAVTIEGGSADDLHWRRDGEASIAAADLNGDDRLDLLVAGAVSDGGTLVLLADGDESEARFRLVRDHPLAAVGGTRCALFGDVDNDGHLDAYLCREGENRLFLGTADGGWNDATARSGTGGGERTTVDGALADLDHDGDLDLYLVNADGPCELLTNLSNGAFRAIGESSGARGDGRPARQVIVADLDADRDSDLVLIHDVPPNEILLNDRLWRYTRAEAGPFADTEVDAAIAVDRDVDGFPEILASRADGSVVPFVRRDGAWKAWAPYEVGAHTKARGGGVAALDVRGAGELSLLVRQATSFAAIDGRGVTFDDTPIPARGTSVRAWTPVVRGIRGPSLAVLTDEGLTLLEPTGSRGAYITIAPSGRIDPSQAMRSNASGIGTRLRVRRDDVWTAVDGVRDSSGPGQSLQPLAIGVGGREGADFVAIEWSDGVFQTEMGVKANARTAIVETQRQISSCPVIFAWDGTSFRFVTDCLGVGGVGYLAGVEEGSDRRLAPVYAPPRPWERVLLPATLALAPRDGALELRLGEPMEEALYLDAARLVAYDLPPGWDMTVDERMGIGDPQPTGEVRFVRRSIALARGTADGADDVTPALLAADGVAAEPGEVDPRFIGLLSEPRTLTLEFASPIGGKGHVLVAHGWVEYPYCQTNFAAWQAGRTYDAPDLEARDASGRWTRVLGQWGYPAGMPREISLPLDAVPPGSTALRLSTTQEIYWDAFRVDVVDDCPGAERTALALVGASVADTGFARRVPQPQRRPDYDYSSRAPFWSTRHQPGHYTEFGPCDELLAATDDAVAIVGPGEEVRLRFEPPRAAQRDGWTRRYVLEVDGWCKDMDLFTGDGATVGPLPRRDGAQSGGAREALHRRFQTRWRGGF